MPKGINADGSPKKRPAGSGKKAIDESGKKVSGSWALSPKVIAIIKKQPNQAAFIEDAITEKDQRESKAF